MSSAYTAGRWALLHQLGLTKTAAVPPEVLEAIKATGSLTAPAKAGIGKSWSLMGGEGGKMTRELQARMQGASNPEYTRKFLEEADKLLGVAPETVAPISKVRKVDRSAGTASLKGPAADTIPDARLFSDPFAGVA